jgi:hypothetical protein
MDRQIIDMFMDRVSTRYSEYERVANQKDIPKGKEYRAAETTGVGDVEEIGEGGRPAFDVPEEGNEKGAEATKYGLGVMFTEEMLDDDYHGKIEGTSQTLADAAVDKINTIYFDLFSSGDDTHQSWDSAYAFATHTTLKSGENITNLGTSALSETAFQAAFEYFDDLIDGNGRKTMIEGNHLMVATALRWMGNRLLRQQGGISTSGTAPDLSGNDMSTNPENGYVNGWTLGIYKYLSADTDWFFMNREQHQFFLLWKKRVTIQSSDDFQTDTRMYKVTFRCKPSVFDYRQVYGYIA